MITAHCTAQIIAPYGALADLNQISHIGYVGQDDVITVIQHLNPMPVDVPFRAVLLLDGTVIAVSDVAVRDNQRNTLMFRFGQMRRLLAHQLGIRYIGFRNGKWEVAELLEAPTC